MSPRKAGGRLQVGIWEQELFMFILIQGRANDPHFSLIILHPSILTDISVIESIPVPDGGYISRCITSAGQGKGGKIMHTIGTLA